MRKTFIIQVDDLNQQEYTLLYVVERSEVRLVGYRELHRESTRKRNYIMIRWYDWYNTRDRHQNSFIPIEQITLPQSVKQAFVQELVESLTFITTENR